MSFPLSASFLRFSPPKSGTPMTERPSINVKNAIIIDYRPNFLMYKLMLANPQMDPITETKAAQRA